MKHALSRFYGATSANCLAASLANVTIYGSLPPNTLSVAALAELTGWDVTVMKGAGHMLPKDYVGAVLEGWFSA